MDAQVAIFLAVLAGAAGGEELAGIYSAQLVLRPGLVHKVKGRATIDSKGVLAIAPGATVEFEKNADGSPGVLTVMGRLFAQGKKKQPIVLRGEGVLCVGKRLTIRESLRVKAQSPVCGLAYAAFDGVALSVIEGDAQLVNCAFADAGIRATGGKLMLGQCTVRGAPNAGLEIERYDTYPTVQVAACTFERCDVGASIAVKTLRPARAYIMLTACNFLKNQTASIVYDDSVNLALGRVHFDGELDCPRGRLIVKEPARTPITHARAAKEVEALLPER